MADANGDAQAELIKAGLEDPFIRATGGVVVLAIAASFVISLLGDGMRAILAIGLSIVFGVILVLMRVLTKNTDGAFVKALCYVVTGAIAAVFVSLVLFVVPAVVICWPEVYHDTLGLKACPGGAPPIQPPFTPIAYNGPGIVINPDNGRYDIRVFYRTGRQVDAERVVGALLSAGYKSEGRESTLNEVETDDRSADVTLIKTTEASRPLDQELGRIVRLAIPVQAAKVRTAAGPPSFAKGDVQIDLF